MTLHIPVLLEDTLNGLELKETDIILDVTMGMGGHSQAILEKIPKGQLIGIDQDIFAIETCNNRFKENSNVHIFQSNFNEFPKALEFFKLPKVDKVLADIGMSSYHLDKSERGFTYSKDEPLDMRMDIGLPLTAQDILETYSKAELKRIFIDFGELYGCDKFIENIVFFRKTNSIDTTTSLINLIKQSFFFKNKRHIFIKTCAQVFQSLRIEVNQELSVLTEFLEQLKDYVNSGGIIAIITFHSLEDRIVKQFVKDNKEHFERINKKVIQPTQTEIRSNPRAKSAKLRLFKKR